MAGKLKPLDIERETKAGKYADGGGLYLIVASATAKNWAFRYRERAMARLGLVPRLVSKRREACPRCCKASSER
jgi:hypothetical protein